eukprot:c16306_g1_i1.p1 GENE.c16306_g1_i1~~c16306_g1_i1.p1  ORF type:complete len:833 (+),score=181.09 c16306_g1_i1:22-2499(+)
MSKTFKRVVQGISDVLDVNRATLSGAIDTIVVEHEDGTLVSTPFHVRFGKLQCLRSREKLVTITVNGVVTPFQMKLGSSGEAFFVEQSEELPPPELQASPIHSPLNLSSSDAEAPPLLEEDMGGNPEPTNRSDSEYERGSLLWNWGELPMQAADGSSTIPRNTSLPRLTDGRMCLSEGEQNPGVLDESSHEHQNRFLLDHFEEDLPPDGISKDGSGRWLFTFFQRRKRSKRRMSRGDRENGARTDSNADQDDLPLSTQSESAMVAQLATPSSDALLEYPATPAPVTPSATSSPTPGAPTRSRVGFEESNVPPVSPTSSPSHTASSPPSTPPLREEGGSTPTKGAADVRGKLDGAGVGREAGLRASDKATLISSSPLLAAAQAVQTAAPSAAPVEPVSRISPILESAAPVPAVAQESDGSGGGLRLTQGEGELPRCDLSLCGAISTTDREAATAAFNEGLVSYEQLSTNPALVLDKRLMVRYKDVIVPWQQAAPILISHLAFGQGLPDQLEASLLTRPKRGWWPFSSDNEIVGPPLVHQGSVGSIEDDHSSHAPTKFAKKTITPSSDMLKALNLRPGSNSISFQVTSSLQGTREVKARIYLWHHTDKIVVSDVDGTITRSDVLGHLLPALGKDWSQAGVAELLTSIANNGYKLVYLTSRAIGQADTTRMYLQSVQQNTTTLPDGPCLMSPVSLIHAFTSEVILRTPEVFKIACLKTVRQIFPPDWNPFYAGFGNRNTDVIAYTRSGVPEGRIFIVNPQGKIQHFSSYRSSYPMLRTLANDMFPPLRHDEEETFNDWNYWKPQFANVSSDESDHSPQAPNTPDAKAE